MENAASYYSVLDISLGSSIEDIRRAYHAKAKKVHPDVNPSPQAHDQFINIHEAFEKVIADRQHRRSSNSGYRNFYPHAGSSNKMHHHGRAQSYYMHRRKPQIDLAETWQGKVFFVMMHLFFAISGLLIFINPFVLVLSKEFNPEMPLADSLSAAFGCMFLGIIMVMLVTKSLFSCIRQFH
jgi:hypothetical protein